MNIVLKILQRNLQLTKSIRVRSISESKPDKTFWQIQFNSIQKSRKRINWRSKSLCNWIKCRISLFHLLQLIWNALYLHNTSYQATTMCEIQFRKQHSIQLKKFRKWIELNLGKLCENMQIQQISVWRIYTNIELFKCKQYCED